MMSCAFHAMGTTVAVFVDGEVEGGPGLLEEVEHEFRRFERILSRFIPSSELSLLNREGSLSVGPELRELVVLALDARERTGGRFDPTVHDAVSAAGYDRSFDVLATRSDESGGIAAFTPRCGGGVFVEGDVVSLEPGFRLDLGGIAKGWAADRALGMTATAGHVLVDAGGDLVGRGRAWPIGVETSDGSLTLELRDGALATSGRDRRRWRRGAREAHHLIDPATARPAETDVLTVTALGATAVEAEVSAKALFLAGSAEAAVEEADAAGVPAVVVTDGGRTMLAGGLA
jgi:thiamine biosynthesis lipoprotein